MLKTPTLVYSSRNPFLSQPRQIGRVKHADLDSFRTMIGNKRRQKRSARRIGRFPGSSQGIRQNRHFEIRIVVKRLIQGLDKFMLRLADI